MGSYQSGIQVIRDTRRYHSIDKLKMLCAFLIVCIHAPFPGMIGEYFTSLTRIAVPIFFMISGYFWKPGNSKKQIIKLIKLFLIGNIIYCAFDFVKAYAQGDIRTFVGSLLNQSTAVNWVLFNDSPFAPHLWYLGAIIYVIVAFSIVEKHRITKLILYLTPVLLLCDLVFGKYSIILFHREFPSVYLRNWIFVGIPYFAIGYFLKERLDNYKEKLSKGMLIGGTCLFSVTTLLERLILVSGEGNAERDHYLSTTFLAVTVFLLFLYYVRDNNTWMSTIGREGSSWIYIFHYLVISLLGLFIRKIGSIEQYNYVRPIVVFVVTTILVQIVAGFMAKKRKT